MNNVPLKRASTFFLKSVVVLIGIGVLLLCIFAFPSLWKEVAVKWSAHSNAVYPGFIGIFATVLPFFYASYQVMKLLHYIDKNNAFSELSISALRNITFSMVVMSMLYATALPLAFAFADADDAPGVVVIAAAITGAPLIVATFAAVLQKLVQNAVDMKSEIDLTV